MTDCLEITENYKFLLKMCDTKTAADVIMFRSEELDEKMIQDIIYTMRGELFMRDMEGDSERN